MLAPACKNQQRQGRRAGKTYLLQQNQFSLLQHRHRRPLLELLMVVMLPFVSSFRMPPLVSGLVARSMPARRLSTTAWTMVSSSLTQSTASSTLSPSAAASSSSSVSFSTTTATSTTRAAASAPVALQHIDFSHHHHNLDVDDASSERPVVVFLHGLLGNKRNFATVAKSLSHRLETKRRIVSLDLRNHGDNTHDWRDDMTYPAMARDVIAWLDANGIDRAVLVAHSMGGKVAMATSLLYPDRVDGLVVLDMAPVHYSTATDIHWKSVYDIVQSLCDVHISQDPAAAGGKDVKRIIDKQLRASIPDPALRAFCLTNLDTTAGQWKINLSAIARQLDVLAGFDLHPDASVYHGDAFFIHGGQSRFVRSSHMPQIATYFPNHLLTTIKGAGHWIHAEAPDDTTALLKRFLDR